FPGVVGPRALVPEDGDIGAGQAALRARNGTVGTLRRGHRPGTGRASRALALRVFRKLRQHHRRRFVGDPAQHHRRADPRPSERMTVYETLQYEEKNGVAWVTLNRPEVHNAFNAKMQQELKDTWT